MDTFVVIEVADNGPGILPEVREKIFEPFVTTKAPGKGVGLGLALCRRLVVEAGGRIEIGDAPEGGAIFSVALPFASEAVDFDVKPSQELNIQVVTTSNQDWADKWDATDSQDSLQAVVLEEPPKEPE